MVAETTTGTPLAWRRKRAEKRATASARRAENHAAKLRAEAAADGSPAAAAAAEWNILRAMINRLPAGVQAGEWAHIEAVLRQASTALTTRHRK
jgi:hypothetical protein